MHQRPIVSRADKRQKSDKQLEFFAAQSYTQCSLRSIGPRRLKEKHSRCSQQVLVGRGLGQRSIDRFCDGFQSGERRANVFVGRDGALEQMNDLGNRHHWRIWIAG